MIKGMVVMGIAFVAGAAVGISTYREHTESVEAKVGPALDRTVDTVRLVGRLVRRKINAVRSQYA